VLAVPVAGCGLGSGGGGGGHRSDPPPKASAPPATVSPAGAAVSGTAVQGTASGSTAVTGSAVTGTATTPLDTGSAPLPPEQTTGGAQDLTRPFSPESPWNTPVTNAPLAANSARLIALAEERFGVIQGNSLEQVATGRRTIRSPLFINTRIWTDPIVLASGGGQTRLICRQVNLPPPNNECGDGWQVSSIPVPSSGFPKPQYDGWLTVIDQGNGLAYDFWRARLTGEGTMTYQFMRRWDLNGPGFLPPSFPGARGSGLPLFAGELLPKEIESGQIKHALAISVPGPAARFYVQPASATDGNGEFGSLPEGARIRLKPDFSVANAVRGLPGRTNARATRAILTALKTYGAIVVDRSRVPTLYAVPNFDWGQPLRNRQGQLVAADGSTPLPKTLQNPAADGTPLLNGNEVRGLRMDDFEVIKLPPVLEFPPAEGGSPPGGVDGVAPQAVTGRGATPGSQVTSQAPSGTTTTSVGAGVP
jgi:hypothetical protein